MNCINGTLARLQLSRLSYKSCKGDYPLQRRVVAGSYNHAGCKTRLQCTHTLICTKEVKKAIQQLLARSSPSGSKTIKVQCCESISTSTAGVGSSHVLVAAPHNTEDAATRAAMWGSSAVVAFVVAPQPPRELQAAEVQASTSTGAGGQSTSAQTMQPATTTAWHALAGAASTHSQPWPLAGRTCMSFTLQAAACAGH